MSLIRNDKVYLNHFYKLKVTNFMWNEKY